MVALADLHDDRVVQQHAGAFQSLALLKVMTALSTNEDAVQPTHRTAADYVKAEMQRLKRFNSAFEELQERQRHWAIPDDGLRRKIRAKWATSIKERYRKMLLPYWDDLTSCKFYAFTPERVEEIIQHTFFMDPSE
ncbi:unnamed protein product [Closterium sp. NIES-65]|nr:unnamed protein product [Closterium sp. NIES-65]